MVQQRIRRGETTCRNIRYTAAEWQAIVEAARTAHTTASAFVRETSLAAVPGDHATPETTPLIVELGRCGTALARLAATAKATGALPDAARLETALAELLAAVRRLP